MRTVLLTLLVVLTSVTGCNRFLIRTQNVVDIPRPVETRVDIPPVNPTAGPVRPVPVQPGSSAVRVAVVDIDGVILNAPFVGPPGGSWIPSPHSPISVVMVGGVGWTRLPYW